MKQRNEETMKNRYLTDQDKRDPRQAKIPLVLRDGAGQELGSCVIRAGAIESVSRHGDRLKVEIRGHMTLYVEALDHLLTDLLYAQARCVEYEEAEAELAGEAIQ
jgi:hypothetical protein